MNRRDFVKASLFGGGLLLTFNFRAAGENVPADRPLEFGDLLTIMPDGQIRYLFIKHEMGQGVATAMAMILAEELCADWEKVKIEFPDTSLTKFQNDTNGGHDTGGSCTITYQYDVLRKAGAVARQMLIGAAAEKWHTDEGDCYADNHRVIHRHTHAELSFGELALLATGVKIPEVKLKSPKEFKLIGQPKNAKLIPDIVTGKLRYGLDVKVPGMLTALIARCPVFKGKLKSFDASAALKIKGVRKVFATTPIAGLQRDTPWMPHDIRDGVAVVADSFWAAKQGREALKIEWDEGINGHKNTADFEYLAQQRAMHKTDPTAYVGDENAVANLAHVRKTQRASYMFPHQLHNCMEPLNCTAFVQGDTCELWLGSQAPNLVATELTRLMKFAPEKITVHNFPSGGGFGRRYYPDMAMEAVFISRAAGDVPVKMMWTREDDHQFNLGHLFQHMEYQVAYDEHDQLYAWYEKEIRTYTWSAKYADTQLPFMAYNVPHIRYDFEHMIDDELVHSSAWRGVVGHGKFYSECFIDELAVTANKDPYEFRKSMLTEGRDVYVGDIYPISSSRILRVLKLAAEKSAWGKPMPPGSGMGMAVCPYGNSYCAVIAEISVIDKKLKIDKITVAADVGKLINPSGADNQLTGGIVWSLTALFYGGLPIVNGRAVYTNFHQNKLLRMRECPPIEVHFVDTDDEHPWGVGEISSAMGVPAVLNALYAATGKRIRKVPIDPSMF